MSKGSVHVILTFPFANISVVGASGAYGIAAVNIDSVGLGSLRP